MHKLALVTIIIAFTLISFLRSLDYLLLAAGVISVVFVSLGGWLAEKAIGEDLDNSKA